MFENRMLRTLFGPKSDEVTGDWRRWHNEGFCDLYPLPSISQVTKIKKNTMGGARSTYEKGDMYKGLP